MRSLCSFYAAEFKTLHFVFICFAEDLFTLTSNKFRMVYKVAGNPQLDSRDWSMYSNILKVRIRHGVTNYSEILLPWQQKHTVVALLSEGT